MLMEIDPLPMRGLMVMTMAMISPPGGKFPGRTAPPEPQICFAKVPPYGGGISSQKLAYDFFQDERLHIAEDGHQRANRGPTMQGGAPRGQGAPPPSWTGGGPPDMDSSSSIFNISIFNIFQKYVSWSFRSFRELLFLHINNTMAILLKTSLVRVSSIQIMQVRVQNKGKSVWKSRYVGDVSHRSII